MFDIGTLDVENGFIDARIYTDQEVYDLELERVFGKCWLFLAHESQVPDRGSFVQTYMAEDPVLVVRQRDGSIGAFLNQCRHRGMRICTSDAGTSKMFTCSYHGWSYDLAGNLVNVPLEERAYRNELDKSKWGAVRPRIALYKGFVFGTWSDDAPELVDYLGEMAYYFDGVVDRCEGGVEFLGHATKWVVDSNWKFAAEQFASDAYHISTTHSSLGAALFEDPSLQGFMATPFTGRQFAGDGHGTGNAFNPDGVNPFLGEAVSHWYAEHCEEMVERLGETRRTHAWGHGTVFPNFSYQGMLHNMRVWHPRGPGQFEVWSYIVAPRAASLDVKDAIRRATSHALSPAGIFETDDGENWTEVQRVLRGWQARRTQLNAQMGLGHEVRDVNADYPGQTDDLYSEMAARGFYRRWRDLMTSTTGSEAGTPDAAVAEVSR